MPGSYGCRSQVLYKAALWFFSGGLFLRVVSLLAVRFLLEAPPCGGALVAVLKMAKLLSLEQDFAISKVADQLRRKVRIFLFHCPLKKLSTRPLPVKCSD